MSILTPRVHVVGIRFSNQEYTEMSEFCVKKRVRSISDLARMAITAYMAEVNKKDALEEVTIKQAKYVKRLEDKLSALGAEMETLKANQTTSASKTESIEECA
jgi:hypothetical protein